jgi:hypothetical protein
MKKQKNDSKLKKVALKSSGISFSLKRFKKLMDSSRYRPLGFLRKNLQKGVEEGRVAL